jgi:nucleotide-binding universal stress UspA family protein
MTTEAISLAEARSSDPELSVERGQPSRIKTVLLATDLTAASEVATTQAIDLVASIGARLLVVNVIDVGEPEARPIDPFSRVVRLDQQRTNRETPLIQIIDAARKRGIEATYLLWTGEPGVSIVAAAEAEQVDLIVVGTRGLDQAGRFLLGSVSDYVVYHSSCPVLVAH